MRLVRRASKHWTADEDETLRTLIEGGKTATQAALKLRRTRVSVQRRAVILGLRFTQAKSKPEARDVQ